MAAMPADMKHQSLLQIDQFQAAKILTKSDLTSSSSTNAMFKSVEDEKRALDYSPGSSNNDSSAGPSTTHVTKALPG